MKQDNCGPNGACDTTKFSDPDTGVTTFCAVIERPMSEAKPTGAEVLASASRAVETAAYNLAGTTDTTLVADLIIIAARLDMIAQKLAEDVD